MSRRSPEQQHLHALFHTAWGQAKDSPSYDKEVWKELDNIVGQITRPNSPHSLTASEETAKSLPPPPQCPEHPTGLVQSACSVDRNHYYYACNECGRQLGPVKPEIAS